MCPLALLCRRVVSLGPDYAVRVTKIFLAVYRQFPGQVRTRKAVMWRVMFLKAIY